MLKFHCIFYLIFELKLEKIMFTIETFDFKYNLLFNCFYILFVYNLFIIYKISFSIFLVTFKAYIFQSNICQFEKMLICKSIFVSMSIKANTAKKCICKKFFKYIFLFCKICLLSDLNHLLFIFCILFVIFITYG